MLLVQNLDPKKCGYAHQVSKTAPLPLPAPPLRVHKSGGTRQNESATSAESGPVGCVPILKDFYVYGTAFRDGGILNY